MKKISIACILAVGFVALTASAAETPEERKARMAREEAIRLQLKALETEASLLLNPSKKNRPAEGWELQRQIVTNVAFKVQSRMQALRSLLTGPRRPADKGGCPLKYVLLAKEIVAKDAAFTDEMRADILTMVFENEDYAGERAAAREDAARVYAMPAATDRMKTLTLKYLVRWELATKGEQAAFALCDREPHCVVAAAVAKSWLADECYRFEEAGKILEDAGLWLGAAEFWSNERHFDADRALVAYRKVLLDEKQPNGDRKKAYDYIVRDDLELARKMLPWRLHGNNNETNYAIRAINWQVGRGWQLGRGYEPNYYGRFEETVKHFAFIREACAFAKQDVYFIASINGVLAMAATGDTKGAAQTATELCETKSWKPEERYCMALLGAVIAERGEVKDLAAKVQAADKRFAGELAPQVRVKYIERVGSIAMLANNENLVRALNDYRLSLYVPKPKRFYTVRYADRPIEGLAGFEAQLKKADVAKLDRCYGGNMDFLVTDVASGNRGEGIGTSQEKKVPPEMRVLCDANGLHFRYDIPETERTKILAGELSAGSFESYIAPGDNEPYTCFMFGLDGKGVSFYGTTYDCPGHRRMRANDSSLTRCEMAMRDDKVVGYYFLSWRNWLERIPKNGSEWDFEPLFWNRQGSFAFNGTESIHGRSTWGRLVFDLPEAGRIAILRQMLYAAKEHYKLARAARSTAPLGVFCLWEDPEIGDPAFYEEVVVPLEKRLNVGLDLVTSEMKDADVVRLAETYLSDWWNVEYLVQKARTAYLARR